MASALFLYKCKREGADRPGSAQKATMRGFKPALEMELKGLESKTELTRRTGR